MTTTRDILEMYWRPLIEGGGKVRSKQWLFEALCQHHNIAPPFRVEKLLEVYRKDPAFFFLHALHLVPWVHLSKRAQDQLEMIEAIRDHDRVAVRSGHKVSKSNTAAGMGIWWFLTRPQARVPITSASFNQVRQILWYEVKRIYREAAQRGFDLGGDLHEDPQVGLTMQDGRQIFGFSTKEPEKAAGISGRNIFYELDEASGILEPIFEAIEGNRAGGAKQVMYSNATRTSGTFYEAFHSRRAFWRCIHIPSTHSPNAQAGRKIVPGLATLEWIMEKREEWGQDSPLYHVRVLGNFPPQGSNAVIPIYLVEEARLRWDVLEALEAPLTGPLYIGVDPAYYGDDEMVVYPIRGMRAMPPETAYQCNEYQIADAVIRVIEKYGDGAPEIIVRIDEIGSGRAALTALLSKYDAFLRNRKVQVYGVNVSEVSDEPDLYYNIRTQNAFEYKAWLEAGGAIPPDSKLEAESVSPTYEMDARGRYKLPPKEKEKEVLRRSPDRRNALELAASKRRSYTVEYLSAGVRASTVSTNFTRGY